MYQKVLSSAVSANSKWPSSRQDPEGSGRGGAPAGGGGQESGERTGEWGEQLGFGK